MLLHTLTDEELLREAELSEEFTEVPLVKELYDRFDAVGGMPDTWYTEDEMDEAYQKIATQDDLLDEAYQKIATQDDLLDDLMELADDLFERLDNGEPAELHALFKRLNGLKIRRDDLRS